jgi:hypothetical protein
MRADLLHLSHVLVGEPGGRRGLKIPRGLCLGRVPTMLAARGRSPSIHRVA